MQVLKDEVRDSILLAAEDSFYNKDYRNTKLSEIAELAECPTSLIYTYFKNKSELFNAIVAPIYNDFFKALDEEESIEGDMLERLKKSGEGYLKQLLKNHRKLVILIDKSIGSDYEEAKEKMVSRLQKHIEDGMARYSKQKYDPMLSRILASNYTEGLLEIARNYKSYEWAKNILALMNQCYYLGVQSL